MSGEAIGIPRGLPAHLPPGERLLWQGAPEPLGLARAAFHARAVAGYFAVLALVAAAVAWRGGGTPVGAAITLAGGLGAVTLLHLLAWAAARSTVYTLTDRRIVLRIGTALPKSINLPLARIAAIDLTDGGDVALTLAETPPLGWLALWPHARPWRLARPVPMLRCLADAETAAVRIAEACRAAAPARPAPMPAPRALAAVAA